MKNTIGIDVGNYDTKTQHTTTPSSYQSLATRNLLAEEYVYYEGMYYYPTKERNNQQIDKTENNYCLIVSLFGIAKEIIYQIKKMSPNASKTDIQNRISLINEFDIGVGLPAGYISSFSESVQNCYLDNWGSGFSFTYNDYKFQLRLASCSVMPQDYTAVAYNEDIEIVKTYPDYYIIGIGGGTADVIPVSNGQPMVDKCISLEKGSTVMYAEISKTLQHETGKSIEYTTIEHVLLNIPNVVDDARKKRIREISADYTNKLVDEFMHQGLRLSDQPVVFIGGGALLMKDTLEKNVNFVKAEFVEDINANAKYFAAFAS